MLQWWADFLDVNRERFISPFEYAKINNPLNSNDPGNCPNYSRIIFFVKKRQTDLTDIIYYLPLPAGGIIRIRGYSLFIYIQ